MRAICKPFKSFWVLITQWRTATDLSSEGCRDWIGRHSHRSWTYSRQRLFQAEKTKRSRRQSRLTSDTTTHAHTQRHRHLDSQGSCSSGRRSPTRARVGEEERTAQHSPATADDRSNSSIQTTTAPLRHCALSVPGLRPTNIVQWISRMHGAEKITSIVVSNKRVHRELEQPGPRP